jgi:hypothetical protein
MAHFRCDTLPVSRGLSHHARRAHVGVAASPKLLHGEPSHGRPAVIFQHTEWYSRWKEAVPLVISWRRLYIGSYTRSDEAMHENGRYVLSDSWLLL